jgi:dTDP-4-dehydrorhamnose 3,5-epimerase
MTELTEPCLIADPHRFEDARGCFTRIALPEYPTAEENYSLSVRAGTIRGLHWQEPQQAKFVRVIAGAILDACVRLSDGKVFTFEMSAGGPSLLVPEGYAHGFCTLEPNTLVSYKVSQPFAPGAQFGIDPFDPHLDIAWPVSISRAVMSEKDANAPGYLAATRKAA